MNVKDVFSRSYVQLILVYCAILLLGQFIPFFRTFIRWEIFAAILAVFAVVSFGRHEGKELKHAWAYVLLAFIIAVSLRATPYMGNTVPLGYDSGLYRSTIDAYTNALPAIPEASLDTWMKQSQEQGMFIIADVLHLFGSDWYVMETAFMIFFSSLLVLPIYLVSKRYFGERSAAIAALFFAVSMTQFRMFEMMYYRTVFGIYFLLLSVWLLDTKHRWLPVITVTALGFFHRPELLLYGFVWIIHTAMHFRDREVLKRNVLVVVVAALLLVPFYAMRWQESLLSVLIPSITSPGGGTFFDFQTYQYLSLIYLPFGLIGAAFMARRKQFNALFFFFLVNIIIVFFELVFYYRFIITLDIALVILASYGVVSLLENKHYNRHLRTACLAALLLTGLIIASKAALESKPLVSEGQLAAMEWIKGNTNSSAFVVAQSPDTPWVLGWSERRVIAPGFLDWSNWTKAEWFEFMGGTDLNKTVALLNRYNGTLYLYYSNLPMTVIKKDKFNNSCFQKVYETDSSIIYRYLGC